MRSHHGDGLDPLVKATTTSGSAARAAAMIRSNLSIWAVRPPAPVGWPWPGSAQPKRTPSSFQ